MNNFQQLNLPPELLQAIDKLGFTTPTEIQEKTIPVLIKGVKDFIGLAQTGTGKTAAYGLPLISIINNKINKPQGLIICPTRELCLQIQNDLTKYGEFIDGFKAVAVYGGSSISTQIFQLKRNCQIVVATPGRLIDLIDRKAIDLTIVKYVVLDEADEMLQMGFEEDVISILKHTTNREQFWLFSATMPTQIKKVIKNFMQQPYEIQVGTVNSVNKNISHQYCITSSAHRYETLKRILDFNPGIYGIIFARTKVMTQEITEKLIFEGYNIDSLHGDLSQVQRDKVMNQFRKKQLQLIVATDVAARGIDVENLTHVINYELPDELEVYTHRSGRTGRAGKEGICFTIVHSKELYKIKQIERTNKISFHKTDIPTGSDICRKQFFNFIEQFINTKVEEDVISPYMSLLEEKFASFDKQDLLKRLLSVEFQRLLKYYENAIDLNKPERESKNFQDRKEYGRRDNDRKEYGRRDNDRKEYGRRDNDRKEYGQRDNDRKEYGQRDNDRKEYGQKDNDRKDFGRKEYGQKDNDRKDFGRKEYGQKDNDRKDFGRKEYGQKDNDRKDFGRKTYGNNENDFSSGEAPKFVAPDLKQPQVIFITLGLKDNLSKKDLLQFINQQISIPRGQLGKIVVKNLHSYVEIEKKIGSQLVKALDGKNYQGRKIRANYENGSIQEILNH